MGIGQGISGEGFHSEAGLSVLSEIIMPAQRRWQAFRAALRMPDDGRYSMPADQPRVVQASPGAVLSFRMIALEEARRIETARRRDPVLNPDLLPY